MAKALPTLKVVVAGDGSVGKTSLVRRYCEGKFETSRVMTIGVDFQTKLVELTTGVVKLSIWDMAGQERFEGLRGGDEILRATPKQRFLLVGNKADLADLRAVTKDEAVAFARSLTALYVETSALTSQGVRD